MNTTRYERTVMVVDDDGAIRMLVRRVLEEDGWSVLEASDGAEAHRLVQQHAGIELLVTDVCMPMMSGIELAAAVLTLQPAAPVLYMTGYADLLFAQRAILREGQAFIEKPFTRLALRQAVAQLVALTRAAPATRTVYEFVFPEWARSDRDRRVPALAPADG